MRDLGDFGSDINAGLTINDCGQVTGYASLPVGFHARHAFLYSNGRLRDIDGRPLTDAVDNYSIGNGINCLGHVVGYSDHLSGFIYRGKRMESLNALIDPHRGWNISAPAAINNAGQIAATAYRHGRQYAVRLDLIRPMAVMVPEQAPDDLAAAPLTPEQARADAEAQAREVVRPVQQ
jgi:probable HAF family extracellular repeat protein